MFIIVNWWFDGSMPALITDDDGNPRKFITEEEAQEYCNTELNGYYKVVELTQ